MRCATCHDPLLPGRLFCAQCGDVTPEGDRVIGTVPAGVGPPVVPPTFATTAPRATPPVKGSPSTTSTSAVLSLVFGLISYVALPFVGALVAVVTGHHARREIEVSGGRLDGDSMAITGLVLGYAQLAFLGAIITFLALAISLIAIVS